MFVACRRYVFAADARSARPFYCAQRDAEPYAAIDALVMPPRRVIYAIALRDYAAPLYASYVCRERRACRCRPRDVSRYAHDAAFATERYCSF